MHVDLNSDISKRTMERVYFPCPLHGQNAEGWFTVIVPGANVLAQGETEQAALLQAAEILQDLIDSAKAEEPVTPADLALWREHGDRPAIIQVTRTITAA